MTITMREKDQKGLKSENILKEQQASKTTVQGVCSKSKLFYHNSTKSDFTLAF